jgi:hypothetical protein
MKIPPRHASRLEGAPTSQGAAPGGVSRSGLRPPWVPEGEDRATRLFSEQDFREDIEGMCPANFPKVQDRPRVAYSLTHR